MVPDRRYPRRWRRPSCGEPDVRCQCERRTTTHQRSKDGHSTSYAQAKRQDASATAQRATGRPPSASLGPGCRAPLKGTAGGHVDDRAASSTAAFGRVFVHSGRPGWVPAAAIARQGPGARKGGEDAVALVRAAPDGHREDPPPGGVGPPTERFMGTTSTRRCKRVRIMRSDR